MIASVIAVCLLSFRCWALNLNVAISIPPSSLQHPTAHAKIYTGNGSAVLLSYSVRLGGTIACGDVHQVIFAGNEIIVYNRLSHFISRVPLRWTTQEKNSTADSLARQHNTCCSLVQRRESTFLTCHSLIHLLIFQAAEPRSHTILYLSLFHGEHSECKASRRVSASPSFPQKALPPGICGYLWTDSSAAKSSIQSLPGEHSNTTTFSLDGLLRKHRGSRSVFIDKKYKILYAVNYKCGSSSFARYARSLANIVRCNPHPDILRALSERNFSLTFVWCDPEHRLVSWYRNWISSSILRSVARSKWEQSISRADLAQWTSLNSSRQEEQAFTLAVAGILRSFEREPHILPQHRLFDFILFHSNRTKPDSSVNIATLRQSLPERGESFGQSNKNSLDREPLHAMRQFFPKVLDTLIFEGLFGRDMRLYANQNHQRSYLSQIVETGNREISTHFF